MKLALQENSSEFYRERPFSARTGFQIGSFNYCSSGFPPTLLQPFS
jgi:hypothetical protein